MSKVKKKWTITKLITACSLGVLFLIVELPGAGINAITGTSIIGGTINSLITPVILTIGLFVLDQFGSATIMLLIFSVLALPVPIFGASGFLIKIPTAISGGVLADLLYLILKQNKKIASMIIGGLIIYYLGLAFVILSSIFNIPGWKVSTKVIFSISGTLVCIIIGSIGGYLGYLIYQKVKNTSVVRRIQS